jgi:hypothetical protein
MAWQIGAGYDNLIMGGGGDTEHAIAALRRKGHHRAAAALSRGAPQVHPMDAPPVLVGDRTIGSGIVAVAANTVQTVPITPQMVFKPKRFIYTGPSATFFIVDALIGQMSMFAGTNPQAADQWGVGAFNTPAIHWRTLQVNQPLSLTVQNATGASANFSATLEGEAAQSQT